MKNSLHEINNIPVSTLEKSQVMTVSGVHNGEAIVLTSDDGIVLSNKNSTTTCFNHASSVPVLSIGDKVIIQEISNILILTDKLRASDELPSVGFEFNNDGSLNLFSDGNIKLNTANAKIDILSNGKILIDGNEVYSLSNGVNRIQGTSIELN